MAENLNYRGTEPDTIGKCYSNNTSNCKKYGRLYNWATAMALSTSCNSSFCASQVSAKHQGICPSGWHIPSNADLDALMTAVGVSAGTKLKATSGWNNNGNGTDNYGFSALPGGGGNSNGNFYNVGDDGRWWSSTEGSADYAYYRIMDGNRTVVSLGNGDKTVLKSVRCLQD
ncbi:MAG: hypothetical protein LBI03_07965, partial [Clostridiales bacterium]|jgi:uncharacterized protein (TIGR02145 family)|nr:hypothetical protein [Clostridiales bacterium]